MVNRIGKRSRRDPEAAGFLDEIMRQNKEIVGADDAIRRAGSG
jgi:hypothetical protein